MNTNPYLNRAFQSIVDECETEYKKEFRGKVNFLQRNK